MISLIVIIILLRKIWKRSDSMFGTDAKVQLISLGVAALVFPAVLPSLIRAIINFLTELYVVLPRALFSGWQNAAESYSGLSDTFTVSNELAYCTTQLSSRFIEAWAQAFFNAVSSLGPSYIPYRELVMMLALWVIVALFLSAPQVTEGDEIAQRNTWLQNAVSRLSPSSRQNILFFVILVLAGNFEKYNILFSERRTVSVTPSNAENAATGPAALTLSSPNLPEIKKSSAGLHPPPV
jgi:hypothetical protein